MLNSFWNLRSSDRLTEWRDFRREISDKSLEQALTDVCALWSTAPYVTYYLAPDDPLSWPDPWTLLAENYYCDLAKSLGMLYTLYFTGHKTANMSLRIYYDYKDKNRYNVLWVEQGKYILNYWPYEIVNTEQIEEKQLQLLYQYSTNDLALEKY